MGMIMMMMDERAAAAAAAAAAALTIMMKVGSYLHCDLAGNLISFALFALGFRHERVVEDLHQTESHKSKPETNTNPTKKQRRKVSKCAAAPLTS